MRNLAGWFVLGTAVLSSNGAYAAGDATAGKTIFENQCASCHSTVPGGEGFGPSLARVIDRKSGAVAGFNYSPARGNARLTLDAKTLDGYLPPPTKKRPGTQMWGYIPRETQR